MEAKIVDGLYHIEQQNGNVLIINAEGLSKKLFKLQFFYDEVLGEIGWDDELEQSETDPKCYCVDEIRNLRKQVKRLKGSLELREAAQHLHAADGDWTCACGAFHEDDGVYCDVCGADRPRR
jgi:hypothetical protein